MSLHKLILSHLQDMPLSLSELQILTQVSLPTLRKAIQELSDCKWICITGQSESNGGRPAMLFGLDESYYAIISIHIQLPGIRLITSDLSGNILDEKMVYENSVPSPREAIQEIESYVSDIDNRFTDRSLLGIGIATPGYTDPDTGSILSIERVRGWQYFPICDLLRSSSELPVYIANDVDCMAFTEFQKTRTSLRNNLMYVGFDEGVKVSLFLNGQLYKGAFSNAGLITANLNTPQGILTIHGINKQLENKIATLESSDQSKYLGLLSINDPRLRLQAMFESSADGDPVCQAIVTSIIETLVKAIVVTTYLIHPDMIVVGGILSTAPTAIYQQIESGIYDALPSLFANHLIIRQAVLSEPNRAALGASHHFLQTYLVDPLTDPLTTITV